MLVVIPTEYRGEMMLLVFPTMVLTSSDEWHFWILFPLSDLGDRQAYPQGVQSCYWGYTMEGLKVQLTWIVYRETTIGHTWILGIFQKLYIYFSEETTCSWRSSLLLTFLPLSFFSYSQSPVCIVLVYQWWGRFLNSGQGFYWWLHHFTISPSSDVVFSYIFSFFIEYGQCFVPSQDHMLQLGGQCYLIIVDHYLLGRQP